VSAHLEVIFSIQKTLEIICVYLQEIFKFSTFFFFNQEIETKENVFYQLKKNNLANTSKQLFSKSFIIKIKGIVWFI